LIKQVVTVNHKKYATGLFWQPLRVGNTAQNYARQLAKNSDKKYTLYVGYKSMVGLTDTREGANAGMSSAAIEIVSALSDLVSFLGVFQADNNNYYLIAVRNGVIIRDILLTDAQSARKLFMQMVEIPDWGALFAPASWGIPKSQEKQLSDLMGQGANVKLHEISTVKSMIPTIVFLILFAIFGYVVLKNSVINQNANKPTINAEKVAEYKKQIEEKTQKMTEKIMPVITEQSVDYAYNHLPNVKERAELCYRAIAFVMQPVMGWNQTYARCDEEYVSANFSRDFGTLNDFYDIGGDLMPGAMVQQMSDDEIVVRVKLPALKTYSSIDERDQTTLMRDVTTIFQQSNINANIQGVIDRVSNGGDTENIYVTEVGVSSKLIPPEFMRAFDEFDGVYMPSVTWRANTKVWNYEVVIYSK